jgi:hypothetical protein
LDRVASPSLDASSELAPLDPETVAAINDPDRYYDPQIAEIVSRARVRNAEEELEERSRLAAKRTESAPPKAFARHPPSSDPNSHLSNDSTGSRDTNRGRHPPGARKDATQGDTHLKTGGDIWGYLGSLDRETRAALKHLERTQLPLLTETILRALAADEQSDNDPKRPTKDASATDASLLPPSSPARVDADDSIRDKPKKAPDGFSLALDETVQRLRRALDEPEARTAKRINANKVREHLIFVLECEAARIRAEEKEGKSIPPSSGLLSGRFAVDDDAPRRSRSKRRR